MNSDMETKERILNDHIWMGTAPTEAQSAILAAMQEYSDQQNAELLAWKESAMRELNALDLQSLGRKLGIGLGQSVSENIQAKVDGLLERVKELEVQNKRLKIAHYAIVRAYEEYGPLASVSTKQVSENVLKETGFDPSKETL